MDISKPGRMTKSSHAGFRERLERLQKKLDESNLDGTILVPGPNLKYYCGDDTLMLERVILLFIPKTGDPHLVAPDFRSGQYHDGAVKIVMHEWNDEEGPSNALEELSNQLLLKGRWGLDGRVPFRFLSPLMKHATPEWVDAEPILQSIREIKEDGEIRILKRAASILGKSYLEIPAILKLGITEIELSRKLSEIIYSNDADLVFIVQVQGGERAADPHSLPSKRKLKRNEPVVIDIASTFSGYYADITRTVSIGRKNRHFEDLYGRVLEAQERAIRISKPGLTVGSVDAAARDYLREKNLGGYFRLRTGHGLGLEVHEAPYIVGRGSEVLRPGMVYTVEPGVYIPNDLGIRIEDDVLLTGKTHQMITSMVPKEFGWWS